VDERDARGGEHRQVLKSIDTFFTANPGETLMTSMKEEIAPSGSTNTFEQTFGSYVAQYPERWYLGPSIPTLDQVRGKIVLLRRFGATTLPTGIDATRLHRHQSGACELLHDEHLGPVRDRRDGLRRCDEKLAHPAHEFQIGGPAAVTSARS
jgi:hypothetical protein